ncbi:jerky-like protein [Trichonephila clavipes]|nr:jerky-like protein [Trichonephila clavipes]
MEAQRLEHRDEILNRLAKGESGVSLAQFYNVGKSGISEIKKSRETFLNFKTKLDSEEGSKKRKTTREANDVFLDRALYLWFSQRRSKRNPISGSLLREKLWNLTRN